MLAIPQHVSSILYKQFNTWKGFLRQRRCVVFDRPQHFGAGTNCRCYLLVQRARCCLQTGLRKYFDRSSNETTAAAGVILKWAWNSDLCVSDLKQALIFRVGEGWPSSELMASSSNPVGRGRFLLIRFSISWGEWWSVICTWSDRGWNSKYILWKLSTFNLRLQQGVTVTGCWVLN